MTFAAQLREEKKNCALIATVLVNTCHTILKSVFSSFGATINCWNVFHMELWNVTGFSKSWCKCATKQIHYPVVFFCVRFSWVKCAFFLLLLNVFVLRHTINFNQLKNHAVLLLQNINAKEMAFGWDLWFLMLHFMVMRRFLHDLWVIWLSFDSGIPNKWWIFDCISHVQTFKLLFQRRFKAIVRVHLSRMIRAVKVVSTQLKSFHEQAM